MTWINSPPEGELRDLPWSFPSRTSIALYMVRPDWFVDEYMGDEATVVGAAGPVPTANLALLSSVTRPWERRGLHVDLSQNVLAEAGRIMALRWTEPQSPIEHLDTARDGRERISIPLPPGARVLGATIEVGDQWVVNAFAGDSDSAIETETETELYVADADVTELPRAVRVFAQRAWRIE